MKQENENSQHRPWLAGSDWCCASPPASSAPNAEHRLELKMDAMRKIEAHQFLASISFCRRSILAMSPSMSQSGSAIAIPTCVHEQASIVGKQSESQSSSQNTFVVLMHLHSSSPASHIQEWTDLEQEPLCTNTENSCKESIRSALQQICWGDGNNLDLWYHLMSHFIECSWETGKAAHANATLSNPTPRPKHTLRTLAACWLSFTIQCITNLLYRFRMTRAVVLAHARVSALNPSSIEAGVSVTKP